MYKIVVTKEASFIFEDKKKEAIVATQFVSLKNIVRIYCGKAETTINF